MKTAVVVSDDKRADLVPGNHFPFEPIRRFEIPVLELNGKSYISTRDRTHEIKGFITELHAFGMHRVKETGIHYSKPQLEEVKVGNFIGLYETRISEKIDLDAPLCYHFCKIGGTVLTSIYIEKVESGIAYGTQAVL